MNPREKHIYKVTLVGSAVNAILIVLKLVAGIVGRSAAMTADAIHSLTDFATDIIVLIFVKIAGKPNDAGHKYGHGKYETFAAMVIGVILAGAGVVLGINGIRMVLDSIHGKELEQPGMIALVVAVASILLKEWLYRYTARAGREEKSEALVANAWHHRSDAISSLGTLAGVAGAMFLGARWRILDPLAAVLVSLFIIKAAYDIFRPAMNELMESALPAQQQEEISRILLGVDGIRRIHNLRTRKVGNNIAIDLHAKMDGDITLRRAHDIASEAERRIRNAFGPDTYINIHMEPERSQKAR